MQGLLKITDVRSRVSDAEWQTRVDLAAAYRLMPLFGMSDLVYNHITARVPGSDDRILINPYGYMYEEITASSLVTINLAGEVLLNPTRDCGVNQAGYVIHSAVHAARHDVQCVIHTHTRAGMAISALKCGLLPMTQTAMRFHTVAYHDYESVAIDLGERERLVRDLGEAEVMILRNQRDGHTVERLQPVMGLADLQGMIAFAHSITVAPSIETYIVALANFTRTAPELRLGVSPRGSLALVRACRASALASGRLYVTPEDVKALAPTVLAHRVIVTPEAELSGKTGLEVIQRALQQVPVPRSLGS